MATWTTPKTWSSAAVTAAEFNEQIRDNETWLKGAFTQLNVTSDAAKAKITPALVGAKVYKAADQSISDNTTTAVNFDSERFDSDAFHDNATNNTRLTIPSSFGGYYIFVANIAWASSAAGHRRIIIRQTGATDLARTDMSASVNVSYAMPLVLLNQCAAADYFEVTVLQTSGGSLAVTASNESPTFAIHRLSST